MEMFDGFRFWGKDECNSGDVNRGGASLNVEFIHKYNTCFYSIE